jgi:hypothetical protein
MNTTGDPSARAVASVETQVHGVSSLCYDLSCVRVSGETGAVSRFHLPTRAASAAACAASSPISSRPREPELLLWIGLHAAEHAADFDPGRRSHALGLQQNVDELHEDFMSRVDPPVLAHRRLDSDRPAL